MNTDSNSANVSVGTLFKNFRGGIYDLVILDIKMREVDGFQFYQKIRRTDSRVKICFFIASEL